jgi:hypothetical protein
MHYQAVNQRDHDRSREHVRNYLVPIQLAIQQRDEGDASGQQLCESNLHQEYRHRFQRELKD